VHRYKITFAYDGSNFAGFQVQPGERTVQQVLERAVNKIAKKPTPPLQVIGSGRTDAGVHAYGQVAHFDLPYQIPGPALVRALNSSLPLDVLVKEATEVSADFHARFGAHHKRYRYRVVGGEFTNPFKRKYTGHFKYPVNVEKMQAAAKDLVGEHDFTSFVASGSQAVSNVRRIDEVTVVKDEENDEVVFDFVGNGFLYNQVRIMVAFLLEIGNGRRPVSDVKRVLAAKNRDLARGTAPASGLYLMEVTYDSPVNSQNN
jgi:tRNA pseudouridine38-40 synthase